MQAIQQLAVNDERRESASSEHGMSRQRCGPNSKRVLGVAACARPSRIRRGNVDLFSCGNRSSQPAILRRHLECGAGAGALSMGVCNGLPRGVRTVEHNEVAGALALYKETRVNRTRSQFY